MNLRKRLTICALTTAGLLSLQLLLPPSHGGILRKALFDAGHVPLFGVFSLALLATLRPLVSSNRSRLYLLSFLGVIVVGGLTEYAQSFTARDSEFMDVVRNVLGGACFLLLALAFERADRLRALWRVPAIAVAFGLAALSLLPLAGVFDALERRDQAFPTLFAFDEKWELHFIRTRDASAALVDGSAGRALEMDFYGSDYPAVILHQLSPDWSGWERLAMEVSCEKPTTLFVRIDDAQRGTRRGERYDGRFELQPGNQRIEIPLEDIRQAPASRQMDLRRMHSITLFTGASGTVLLEGIRLAR